MDIIFELIDSIDEYCIWLEKDDNGENICSYANQPFLKRVGYKPTDIFNQPLRQFITDRDFQTISAIMDPFKDNSKYQSNINNPFSISFKQLNQNKWTKLTCYAARPKIRDKQFLFLCCIEIDTRYKNSLRIAQLYEEAIDGIFTLHESGKVRNGNKKIEQLVGSRSGRLTVDFFKNFIPAEKSEGLIKYLNHRLKGEMENLPYYISIKSQNEIEKHYSVRTIKNPITESEIIVHIRDDSDVKRLENELRQSERKYRSVVEQSKDIIFISKRDRVIFANNVANQRLGNLIRDPNLHWKDYLKVVIEEDRDRTIDFVNKCNQNLADGFDINNQSTEFRLVSKTGEILHMVMTLSSIDYIGEKAMLGTVRDITERKKLEAKTTESVRMGTLAQFAASVAHEIRNPLEALTSAGLLLSRSLKLEGENKQLLDAINNATEDINTVIRQFISMTTVPEYHFVDTCIKSLFQSVIKWVKGLPSYSSLVEITISHQRGLPDIQCDMTQLSTSLCNIVNNSCNAINGKGTIKIRVEKTELNTQPAIKISIKDSGDGIPKDILAHIWEPFFTSKKKGMGLGLFIAKHCTEAHRGRISIPYSDKRGTMVQIVLPVHQETR